MNLKESVTLGLILHYQMTESKYNSYSRYMKCKKGKKYRNIIKQSW